jgi:hypothetical protein
MRKLFSKWCLLATLVIVAGCDRPLGTGGDPGSDVSGLPVSKESSPSTVVSAYLDALRSDDHTVAERLLTTTAREETAAYNLPVQAPGSPAATYVIGNTTRIKDGTQVGTRWTETSEAGETLIYDIDWMLRQTPQGWRVVGMSTSLTPDGDPIYVSFEDVPDMLRKWDEADAELARLQDETAARQARRIPEELPR